MPSPVRSLAEETDSTSAHATSTAGVVSPTATTAALDGSASVAVVHCSIQVPASRRKVTQRTLVSAGSAPSNRSVQTSRSPPVSEGADRSTFRASPSSVCTSIVCPFYTTIV
jgi:hypothetical protein